MSESSLISDVVSSYDGVVELDTDTSLTSEDFYEILIAEITNQDPLEPMSNSDLTLQILQLNTLESNQEINETLTELAETMTANSEALYTSSNYSTAASLIGKDITYSGTTTDEESGEEVEAELSGTVSKVNIEDGELTLIVNGTEVALSDVISFE